MYKYHDKLYDVENYYDIFYINDNDEINYEKMIQFFLIVIFVFIIYMIIYINIKIKIF